MKLPCPTCRNGTLRPGREVVWLRGVRLGEFLVSTCTVCGAQLVDDPNGRAIDLAFEKARSSGALTPRKKPARRTSVPKRRAGAP